MICHRRIVKLSIKGFRVDVRDQLMHRRNHIAIRGANYQPLGHLRCAIFVRCERRLCKQIELRKYRKGWRQRRKPHRFSPAVDEGSKHISFSDPFRSLIRRSGNAKLAFSHRIELFSESAGTAITEASEIERGKLNGKAFAFRCAPNERYKYVKKVFQLAARISVHVRTFALPELR